MTTKSVLQTAGRGRKKILMVTEDSDEVVQSYFRGLSERGFCVDWCDDPTEALANFKRRKYVATILDMQLPKLSGFELYRRMRDVDPAISCCFLTPFSMDQEELTSMFADAGARTVLTKPVSPSDLNVALYRLQLASSMIKSATRQRFEFFLSESSIRQTKLKNSRRFYRG